jgi:fucose permease
MSATHGARRMSTPKWRTPPVVVVYLNGVVQGMSIVSVPALGAVLKAQLDLSDAEYGAVFLPQLVFAVIGALGGGALSRRIGLKALLVLALLAIVAAQSLLAASGAVPDGLAFPALLLATASLGLGVGLQAAPINTYPAILFPGRSHAAVVAAHMLIGLGLATGPLLVAPFIAAGVWSLWPAALAGIALVLAVVTGGVALPSEPAPAADGDGHAPRPVAAPLFRVFVVLSILYAFAEGTFANWVVVFLSEGRGLDDAVAGAALSVFWGALVVGRLGGSALVGIVSPRLVWAAMPVLMAAAFLLIPLARGPVGGIAVFAFAGLACSAYFPLMIAIAAEIFPRHVAWVASALIAALMVGIGAVSFLIGAAREVLSFEAIYRLSALWPLLALVLAIPVLRHRPAAAPAS